MYRIRDEKTTTTETSTVTGGPVPTQQPGTTQAALAMTCFDAMSLAINIAAGICFLTSAISTFNALDSGKQLLGPPYFGYAIMLLILEKLRLIVAELTKKKTAS